MFKCNKCGRFICINKSNFNVGYIPDSPHSIEKITYTHIKCKTNDNQKTKNRSNNRNR